MLQRLTVLWIGLLVAGCVVGVLVPAGLGWDFANFYDAGRRVAAGESANLYAPASLIAGQPPQGRTGFFGAPVSALFYLPIAGFGPEAALILFKLANVAAFGVTFGILFRFYARLAAQGAEGRWAFAAWFTFLCLIYQPFWTVFRVGGQTTPFVLLALSAALVCHVRGRFWGSATGVTIAALIKPSLAPAVLFLMLVSGRAFLGRTIAVFGAAGVLSILLLGWPVHLSFLELMRRSSQITYDWHFNSALFILVDNLRLALGPRADSYSVLLAGLSLAVRTAAVALVAVLTLQAHRANLAPAARRHLHVQLALVLFLLSSLTIWEHYLALLFPLLAYTVASRDAFGRPALWLAGAIFVLAVGQNFILIDWLRRNVAFDSAPRLMTIAVLKSAPLLLTAALLWYRRVEFLASHTREAWRTIGSASGRAEP